MAAEGRGCAPGRPASVRRAGCRQPRPPALRQHTVWRPPCQLRAPAQRPLHPPCWPQAAPHHDPPQSGRALAAHRPQPLVATEGWRPGRLPFAQPESCMVALDTVQRRSPGSSSAFWHIGVAVHGPRAAPATTTDRVAALLASVSSSYISQPACSRAIPTTRQLQQCRAAHLPTVAAMPPSSLCAASSFRWTW